MKKFLLVSIIAIMMVAAFAVPAMAAVMVSGPGSAMVYGPVYSELAPGAGGWGVGTNSVLSFVHSAWPTFPNADAQWIANTHYTGGTLTADQWRWFRDSRIVFPTNAYAFSGTVQVTVNSDNSEEVFANDVSIGRETDAYAWQTIVTRSFTPTAGVNNVDFVVKNLAGTNSPTANPTGLIYSIDTSGVSYLLLPSVGDKVTGGGKFDVGGIEVQLNFVAMATEKGIKGNLKYSNSNDVSFWGDVTGYYQSGDRAYIVGTIVKGSDADGNPLTGYFYVAVEDNGEGDAASPDGLLRALTGPNPYLPDPALATLWFPMTQGNVQLH